MDKIDYTGCIINPEKKEDIERLKANYDEFLYENNVLTPDDKIIKYIVLNYDMNSPLRGLYTNFYERKNKAAVLAGFIKSDKRRYPEEVEDVLIGMNDEVNSMIVRYIIMHGSPDITAYVAYNQILESELKKSLSADSYESKDLKATRDNINAVTKELNELHYKIFGGTEGQKLKDQLYKTLEDDRLRIRPEHIAKDLASDKYEVDVDPYDIGELKYE